MIDLAVSEGAVNTVLDRAEEPKYLPVYYMSKVISEPETRYTPIKKLVLALVMLA